MEPVSPLTLGFSCMWKAERPSTWSHIPWSLRSALQAESVNLVDTGIEWSEPAKRMLRLAHARLWAGRLRSSWNGSRLTELLAARSITAAGRRAGCDAVLQITDLAELSGLPYYVFHDLSFDLLIKYYDRSRSSGPYLENVPWRTVVRWRDRQRRIFDKAEGIFAMSKWLADDLVADTGLPADKVHVLYPGRNARGCPADDASVLRRLGEERRRLLFVGSSFHSKGGPLVLDALRILRSRGREVTLTVAGSKDWTPSSEVDGLNYLGPRPLREVEALFRTHDLYVMPSRFEAFGIAFVEALGYGMPCVARRACAMPEVILPGVNGTLVEGDDAEELASAVESVLGDQGIYETCRDQIPEISQRFSWTTAAREVIRVASHR